MTEQVQFIVLEPTHPDAIAFAAQRVRLYDGDQIDPESGPAVEAFGWFVRSASGQADAVFAEQFKGAVIRSVGPVFDRLARLESALKFYADRDNYDADGVVWNDGRCDRGRIAADALAARKR